MEEVIQMYTVLAEVVMVPAIVVDLAVDLVCHVTIVEVSIEDGKSLSFYISMIDTAVKPVKVNRILNAKLIDLHN